jgi:hypothetical protein
VERCIAPAHEVGDAQADRLRDPCAGVVERREEHLVAAAAPGRQVERGLDGGELLARQKAQQRRVAALARDREDALDRRQVGRITAGRVVEEGSQRDEPRVAAANRVVAVALEVIEEGQDERRVEVREV